VYGRAGDGAWSLAQTLEPLHGEDRDAFGCVCLQPVYAGELGLEDRDAFGCVCLQPVYAGELGLERQRRLRVRLPTTCVCG
jgi:hypothetical protein